MHATACCPRARRPVPPTWLDLVALGTVADLVPLDRNNRVLVAQGTAAHPRRPLRARHPRAARGRRAQRGGAVVAADLGFAVGAAAQCRRPARRHEHRHPLPAGDDAGGGAGARGAARRAEPGAARDRGAHAGAGAWPRCDGAARTSRDGAAAGAGLCLFDPGWHQGVVGLVASRIKERLRRPVIAFAPAGDGQLRGSARSVPGVHIRDVLDAIATRASGPDRASFGGHAMAAGLTLRVRATSTASRAAFDAEVARWLARTARRDLIETDGELDERRDLPARRRWRCATAGPGGQAFPGAAVRRRFEVREHARRRRAPPEAAVARAEGARRASTPSRSTTSTTASAAPRRAAGRSGWSIGSTSTNTSGERRLQLLVEHVGCRVNAGAALDCAAPLAHAQPP